MENPLAVANYFVKKSFDSGEELTPMKLVKLVYIAHGWYLGLTGDPLIDEPVQAWQYGPVVETVYEHFKKYGRNRIDEFAYVFQYDGLKADYQVPMVQKDELKLFLDKVWDVYKGYNGVQLSTLTHKPNTPWDQVFNKLGGKDVKSTVIDNNLIRQHYKTKALTSTTPIPNA
jgi:uncharacterized phage-associated protein